MPDCSYCHQALPAGALRCPRCGTPCAGESADEKYERHGTLIEPIPIPGIGGEAADSAIQGEHEPEPDDAVAFRPVFRAPMAVLTILDDGLRDRGEEFRLRGERTVIGRTNGDILVPHDTGISGQHAEIVRETVDGEYRWSIRDLESRNGTFVRIARARLSHGQQILIGAQRFRFDAGDSDEESDPSEADPHATEPLEVIDIPEPVPQLPALVELGPDGEGDRFPLDQPATIIGGDAEQCAIPLPDDPFVSAVHCRIFRDDRNRWTIENRDSFNGVWLRIDSTAIVGTAEFQLGEQRFSISVL